MSAKYVCVHYIIFYKCVNYCQVRIQNFEREGLIVRKYSGCTLFATVTCRCKNYNHL